jgi:hypothetical protein
LYSDVVAGAAGVRLRGRGHRVQRKGPENS